MLKLISLSRALSRPLATRLQEKSAWLRTTRSFGQLVSLLVLSVFLSSCGGKSTSGSNNGASSSTSSGSGTITTIVGIDKPGYTGDGGQATSAELYGPSALAFDSSGNLYIADRYNNAIRKVSTAGIITTVAGTGSAAFGGDNGLATSAGLNNPEGVAIDSSGNLYIADSGNNRIRMVDAYGIITTVVDINVGLNTPSAVTVDSSGNLYIADSLNNLILKVNGAGSVSTVAGDGIGGFYGDGGKATGAELNIPVGVALDSSGNLYIADYGNNRIRKVSTAGIITTVAGNGFTNNLGDSGLATSAGLYGPEGVAVDSSGNLYIADSFNHRIRKVSASGIITTFAGTGTRGYSGNNGQAVNAELNYPRSVVLDAAGNTYLADTTNNVIRKIAK